MKKLLTIMMLLGSVAAFTATNVNATFVGDFFGKKKHKKSKKQGDKKEAHSAGKEKAGNSKDKKPANNKKKSY